MSGIPTTNKPAGRQSSVKISNFNENLKIAVLPLDIAIWVENLFFRPLEAAQCSYIYGSQILNIFDWVPPQNDQHQQNRFEKSEIFTPPESQTRFFRRLRLPPKAFFTLRNHDLESQIHTKPQFYGFLHYLTLHSEVDLRPEQSDRGHGRAFLVRTPLATSDRPNA